MPTIALPLTDRLLLALLPSVFHVLTYLILSPFVVCRNLNGQLGDSTHKSRTTLGVVDGAYQWLTLQAGVDHTCGIISNYNLFCWGKNSQRQIGLAGKGATNFYVTTPTEVFLPNGILPVAVSPGDFHTCALGADSLAYCWYVLQCFSS